MRRDELAPQLQAVLDERLGADSGAVVDLTRLSGGASRRAMARSRAGLNGLLRLERVRVIGQKHKPMKIEVKCPMAVKFSSLPIVISGKPKMTNNTPRYPQRHGRTMW